MPANKQLLASELPCCRRSPPIRCIVIVTTSCCSHRSQRTCFVQLCLACIICPATFANAVELSWEPLTLFCTQQTHSEHDDDLQQSIVLRSKMHIEGWDCLISMLSCGCAISSSWHVHIADVVPCAVTLFRHSGSVHLQIEYMHSWHDMSASQVAIAYLQNISN